MSAPDPITQDDLIAALEQIEMLTATGTGMDPETTMQVHLLAGIGRATHDRYAWYTRSDLCASGQQVRADRHEIARVIWDAMTWAASQGAPDGTLPKYMEWGNSLGECEARRTADRILAALTPAPQPEATENYADTDSSARQPEGDTGPSVVCNKCGWEGDEDGLIATLDAEDGEPCRACPECRTDANLMDVLAQPSAATPTAQEAVPVAWMLRDMEGVICAFTTKHTDPVETNWTPLYAHPPQPSETVAEAATHALDACRIIDAAALEGHDNASDLICHLLEAVEPARAALRALKGIE